MSVRVLGAVVAVLAALVVGLVGGGVASYVVEPASVGAVGAADGADQPLASASPPVPTVPPDPVEPTVDPLEDIDYPPLVAPTDFRMRTIGATGYQDWRYPAPRDWITTCVGGGGLETEVTGDAVAACAEVRFRPPDEPEVGGYSLRVKVVTSRLTTLQMVDDKISLLEGSSDLEEVTVLSRDADSVHATLLTPTQMDGGGFLLRHNYFRWFAAPGSSETTLEMSVTGRAVDAGGLEDLFQTFASRTRAVS